MPAKAGIHDFFAAPASSAFMRLTEQSWMPAFAGMTGFFGGHRHIFASLAAQLRAPLIFGYSNERSLEANLPIPSKQILI
jgi:hypothetical protein